MESSMYSAKLERKLITDFKELFYDKMGYYPLIYSRYENTGSHVPYMTLAELEKCFDDFLPIIDSRKHALKTKRRNRELVELRAIFCHLAVAMKYSLTTTAKHLGQRHHTTVIHNLKLFKNLTETSEVFREKYKQIYYHILSLQINLENEPPILESL